MRIFPLTFSFVLAAMPGLVNHANADSIGYEVTGNRAFGTIDLSTGQITTINSNMGVQLAGLGEYGGLLYGGVSGINALVAVNPADGAISLVGAENTSIVHYVDFGSTRNGLYALAQVDGSNKYALYSVNPANGSAINLGSTSLSIVQCCVGMSSGANGLYLTYGSQLYTLDTTSGMASLIGSTNSTIGAMVAENGNLYGSVYEGAPRTIEEIDPTTGSTTFVANESPQLGLYGLAPAFGVDQNNPIYGTPQTCLGSYCTWLFNGPDHGWFDPPLADSYTYQTLDGSDFTSITLPSGFSDPFLLSSDGMTFGLFDGGQSLQFPNGGVTSFTISDITPSVDGSSPDAFPVYLTFDQATVQFEGTAFTPQSTPEPASWQLLSISLFLGLIARMRRLRRSRY